MIEKTSLETLQPFFVFQIIFKNILFIFIYFIFTFNLIIWFLIKHLFIAVQLQLSEFSPLLPQTNPPLSPTTALPHGIDV